MITYGVGSWLGRKGNRNAVQERIAGVTAWGPK